MRIILTGKLCVQEKAKQPSYPFSIALYEYDPKLAACLYAQIKREVAK